MEIAPATTEQIGFFKLGFARRCAERNVPPQVADQLFENEMKKIAADLGIDEKGAACGTKHGKKKDDKKKDKKAEARVKKLAEALTAGIAKK